MKAVKKHTTLTQTTDIHIGVYCRVLHKIKAKISRAAIVTVDCVNDKSFNMANSLLFVQLTEF